MPSAGDVANFLLGGIPGDVHDLFTVDVEPGDLVRAAGVMTAMGDTVRTIHVQLSGSVASLEGRWEGDGAAAFDSELWQPLSHGLGVLERECDAAGSQLTQLACQAETAHLQKISTLEQEMQNQIWLTAATTMIGAPEVGGAIGKGLTALATRLGGDIVGRIVAGIVQTIEDLLRRVLEAFNSLFSWAAKPVDYVISELRGDIAKVFPSSLGGRAPSILAPSDLSAAVASNLGRFENSLPAGAGDTRITQLGDGSIRFEADVAARNIPGSYATYTKVVNPDGSTVTFYKTTVAPDGSIVSVKMKYP